MRAQLRAEGVVSRDSISIALLVLAFLLMAVG